ncbi:hypothetical protein CRE_17543 [Caenorhabditis remanei]|uniref:Uncharacterized protein n=1 Tax=Caenorhabditis remanei TaxID=31234 RepID=E3NC12_CAERE|nr:hypothetical protein CRE_17543 [Caenorhabditis remanei]
MTRTVTKAASKAATDSVVRHKPEDMSGVAITGMMGLGIGVLFLLLGVGAVVWANRDDSRRAREAAEDRPAIRLKRIEPVAPADNAQQGQDETIA